MLGMDRRAAQWTWTAALVLLLLYVLYLIREPIFVFIVAVLLAYILAPIVDAVNRILPSRSRAPALAVTYVLLIGLLIVFGIEVGSRVVDEAGSLISRAPQFIQNLQNAGPDLPLPGYLRLLKGDVFGRIQGFVQSHSSDLLSFVPTAGLKVLTWSSYLLFFVLVPILSFFLLKDGNVIVSSIVTLVPGGPNRRLLENVIADMNVVLSQYVRAMTVLGVVTFVVFATVFLIFGVPYGVLLAAIAFPLEFIPLIGPLTAAIIIVLVTQAAGYGHLLWILLFLGGYRVFQDYVLSPRLMSAGVEVHPLLVIVGVLAGEKIGGIPGMFLSVPVIAFIRVIYVRLQAQATAAPSLGFVHRELESREYRD